MSPPPTLLRARHILPIVAPEIENGAIVVAGNRITAVGSYSSLKSSFSGEAIDLGDVTLLPGLINAHCHLDYTDMGGMPAPKRFPDWIKALLALKASVSYTDYAAAWLRGAGMLLQTGTTTVGDIEAVPELLPDVWASTPLRVFSFLEMTGVKSKRSPEEILQEAATKIDNMPVGKNSTGISPHALYSTSPALLESAGRMARERGLLVTTHLAESVDEAEMYAMRCGHLFDWLSNQRDMSDCGSRTCVQQAARCDLLGENFLAVHCNYVNAEDAQLLGASRASVVHCPRSHDYFGHARFPYDELVKAGVNVCLGTDSLASVTKTGTAPLELSMFAEMRQFAVRNSGVAPIEILKMATINGARALGRAQQIGEISGGALADIITIQVYTKGRDLCESLVHNARRVSAVMIDGQWAIDPEPNRR